MTVKCKTMQALVEDVMAKQGLTYKDLARRRGTTAEAAQLLVRSLGNRNHQIGALTQLSLALNKPGDWLQKELRKRGLR